MKNKSEIGNRKPKIIVVPAILSKTKQDFAEKVKSVAPFIQTIQIDIMDGRFVPNKTWGTPVKIGRFLKEINFKKDFEVHLMVAQPEKVIKAWVRAGAKRIIFHFEATKRHKFVIESIHKNKCQVGMAINPETSVEKIKEFLNLVDMILVMGVNPGFSGQKFQPKVLEKIREIKRLNPKVLVGVDGGVNLENVKQIKKAGVDILNAASAIFKSGNIKEAIVNFDA